MNHRVVTIGVDFNAPATVVLCGLARQLGQGQRLDETLRLGEGGDATAEGEHGFSLEKTAAGLDKSFLQRLGGAHRLLQVRARRHNHENITRNASAECPRRQSRGLEKPGDLADELIANVKSKCLV